MGIFNFTFSSFYEIFQSEIIQELFLEIIYEVGNVSNIDKKLSDELLLFIKGVYQNSECNIIINFISLKIPVSFTYQRINSYELVNLNEKYNIYKVLFSIK